MKAKYFYILSSIVGTIVIGLIFMAVFFKSYAGNTKTFLRSSLHCFSGGKTIFADTYDGRITYENGVYFYFKDNIRISVSGVCILTEYQVDEEARKREEEIFKKSKIRKDIKAKLESEGSQFE